MKNVNPGPGPNETAAKELGLPEEVGAAVVEMARRLDALEKRMSSIEVRTAFIAGLAPQAR